MKLTVKIRLLQRSIITTLIHPLGYVLKFQCLLINFVDLRDKNATAELENAPRLKQNLVSRHWHSNKLLRGLWW